MGIIITELFMFDININKEFDKTYNIEEDP